MKHTATFFMLMMLILLACMPVSLPTATPTHTPQPTATATTPPTATWTPAPTATPLPPLLVDYYRLRVEYLTTSDWTTLEIPDGENRILAMRLVDKIGEPTHTEIQSSQLGLNQSLEAAEQGHTAGMVVDFALSPDAVSQPLPLVLRKGDIGKSILRFFLVRGAQTLLIEEITHEGVVPNSGGLNPQPIEMDLGTLKELTPSQAVIRRPTRRMLWAFYYPWYYRSDWSSSILRDRPMTPYTSDDPETILRQVEQAQQAGIDGFISSWWGPGSYTDRNLETLLRTAQERNFSISIYFETLKESGPRSDEEIFQWLVYAIDKYGHHPAFIQVEGKPVMVIWASGTVPLETWQNIFSNLREQGRDALFLGMGYNLANLSVFDGIHEYGVFGIPNLGDLVQSIGRAIRYDSLLSDEPAAMKIWAATVQPGYDDRLIPGREGLFQDRQGGQFYQSTFEAALQSDPDWIFITTWNEWWEHTYIEPSELYGDLYLRITREFADQWKGGQ